MLNPRRLPRETRCGTVVSARCSGYGSGCFFGRLGDEDASGNVDVEWPDASHSLVPREWVTDRVSNILVDMYDAESPLLASSRTGARVTARCSGFGPIWFAGVLESRHISGNVHVRWLDGQYSLVPPEWVSAVDTDVGFSEYDADSDASEVDSDGDGDACELCGRSFSAASSAMIDDIIESWVCSSCHRWICSSCTASIVLVSSYAVSSCRLCDAVA